MIAVILWELSRRKMFTFWWSVGVTALVALTVLSYLAIEDQAAEFSETFGELSGSAGAFFGGDDLFSPVGYLSSQIYFIMLPLLLIIMGMTLVSSLVSRDENDTTVELTLARPISRRKLLLAKAISGLVISFIIMAVSYVVTVICVDIVNLDVDGWNLLVTHLLSFAFSLSFVVIMFGLVAMSNITKRIAGVAAIVLSFGGYILTSLAGFVEQFEQIVKVFPYYYYDTDAMLRGTIDSGLIIYLIGVLAVVTIVSAVGYGRRDIA